MSEKCTCSKCGHTFVPSFTFDFYSEPTEENPNAGLCEACMMRKMFASKPEPVPVPKGYEETVCRKGQDEATCSFMGAGANGFLCLKGSSMEATIREKLSKGTMKSKGDNCSGSPDFLKK